MEKNKATISKEDMLFERDEKGELIPQEVELEFGDDVLGTSPDLEAYKGKTIWVTPISRGELKKLFAEINMARDNDNSKDTNSSFDDDFDAQVVLRFCHKPSFEKEDLPYLKPGFVSALVDTIFKVSGLQSGKGTRQTNVKKADTDFKKN